MQVSDKAEHLPGVLAFHVHEILDDTDLQAPAAAGRPAGQVAVITAVGQEPADAVQGDVALDADQHMGAGGQHPGHPVSAGEVPVEDPEPAIGEHPGIPGEHRVQERLLALGLRPAGRAGHHRQGAAGGGVGSQQVTDLRVRRAVVSGPGRAERLPVSGSVGNARHRPVDRAQPQLMTRPADEHGSVVMVTVLGAGRGQQPFPQPGQRSRAQRGPPRRHHLGTGDPERALPGHQHQVTQHSGHHLAVVRVRHQRHQHGRADR